VGGCRGWVGAAGGCRGWVPGALKAVIGMPLAGGPCPSGLPSDPYHVNLSSKIPLEIHCDLGSAPSPQISKLEDGGTQVFLLPGIDMINHSHNPARRNSRLERLNLAQAEAAQLLDAVVPAVSAAAVDAAGSQGGGAAADAPRAAEAFFVMRAGTGPIGSSSASGRGSAGWRPIWPLCQPEDRASGCGMLLVLVPALVPVLGASRRRPFPGT
jgi:hypothetical protein